MGFEQAFLKFLNNRDEIMDSHLLDSLNESVSTAELPSIETTFEDGQLPGKKMYIPPYTPKRINIEEKPTSEPEKNKCKYLFIL